jgi:hypothetical protein
MSPTAPPGLRIARRWLVLAPNTKKPRAYATRASQEVWPPFVKQWFVRNCCLPGTRPVWSRRRDCKQMVPHYVFTLRVAPPVRTSAPVGVSVWLARLCVVRGIDWADNAQGGQVCIEATAGRRASMPKYTNDNVTGLACPAAETSTALSLTAAPGSSCSYLCDYRYPCATYVGLQRATSPLLCFCLLLGGLWLRSGARGSYAASRKVAGSIPDEIIEFFLICLILPAALRP